jgi:carboxynorspermidine decarboxylase
MPDVLEMPYRPNIVDAGLPGEKQFTYRLGGPTCLAGDIIGITPLIGPPQRRKTDILRYGTLLNGRRQTFTGMNLPSIAMINKVHTG